MSRQDDRTSVVRHGVLALLCAVAAISYLSRNSISVAENAVRAELGLSLDAMGWIMGVFFFSYASLQIPGGWLAHVLGNRRALPLFAVAWSIATALSGFAVGFVTLFLSRLIMGAAQTGVFPCSVSAVSRWIPLARRASACGSLGSCMSLGAAIASALTGVLLDEFSWRTLFVLFCLPGFVWAAFFYWWFRDTPDSHAAVNQGELDLIRVDSDIAEQDEGRDHTAEPIPWLKIFSSRAMWLICGQQFFRAAGYIFFATWFPKFLIETRGVSVKTSGLLTSLPFLAVVLGSLMGGLLVDWVWTRSGSRRLSRQGVAAASLMATTLCILCAYYANTTMTAMTLITVGTFFSSLASSSGYAITIDMGGDYVTTVFSTMNMAGNIGAFLCPIVVARMVTITGDWNLVLILFVVIYGLAAACWALLNPHGTVFDSSLHATNSS